MTLAKIHADFSAGLQRLSQLTVAQSVNDYLTKQKVPLPQIGAQLTENSETLLMHSMIIMSGMQHPVLFGLGTAVGFGERTLNYQKSFPDNKDVRDYEDIFTKAKVTLQENGPIAQIAVIILFIAAQFNWYTSAFLAVSLGVTLANHIYYEASKSTLGLKKAE